VRAGKPKSDEEYFTVEAEGITFHVANELEGKFIKIERFGWWIFGSLAVTVK
jgi:hypothetical protein